MSERQKIAQTTFDIMKSYNLEYEKLFNIFIIIEKKIKKNPLKTGQ
jgi:hypothetical protein